MSARLALALLAALACAPAPARAQGLGILDRNSNAPIEIEADDGIEWRQQDKIYIARGNVKVVRGETTLYADEVVAHYREAKKAGAPPAKPAPQQQIGQPGSGTEIWKVDAIGKVRIESRSEVVYAERGVYDVDRGVFTLFRNVRLTSPARDTAAYGDEAVYDTNQKVMVLTGRNLRFESPETKVTARDSLEYYETQSMALARGEAVAIQQDKRIRADVLTAHLRPRDGQDQQNKGKKPPTPTRGGGADRGGGVERLDAFGNVHMSTANEIARADKGVYVTATGVAVLSGNVRITRGESQMNGEVAEVNLNTGVSRILNGPAAANTGKRVKAIFVPNKAPAPAGTDEQMRDTKTPRTPPDPNRPRLPQQ